MLRSGILACNVKEKGTDLERFFGISETLEHPFLSRHLQKSLCRGAFSMVVGYIL